MDLIRNISKCLSNIQGWSSRRKFLIIESDDWGSIRMPSFDVYKRCLDSGYPVDKNEYERSDSLLSQDDLELLFDLLTGFKDINGNHPVITANCVVANPDFRKIKEDNFQHYHYELITETFKKYPNHNRNYALWNEAIDHKVLFPQYHCREHLNVSRFMLALKNNDEDAHFAFNNEMPGIMPRGDRDRGNLFIEATNYDSLKDMAEKLSIYLDGLTLFERLFGFKSKSIIPPNYTWSNEFNKDVFNLGVTYFQGIRKMREPMLGGTYKYYSNVLGKMNDLGQIHLVRNCIFEPSLFKFDIEDPVGKCLLSMSAAFAMKKPAVIVSHRVNYSGNIFTQNRDKTLVLLKQLISTALKKWPDIEFITSVQLGHIIKNS